MKNLWIVISPALICALIGIIAIIVLLIKKPKSFVATTIGIVILFVILFAVGLPPFFKDMTKQETISFEGTFVEVQSGGTVIGTNRNIFMVDDQKEKVYIPRIYWSGYNLVEGKRYLVSYFVNTRIVCSIELIG